MNTYVWTNGIKAERSNKKDKHLYVKNENTDNAIRQVTSNSTINTDFSVVNGDSITKRESANNKLNERELTKQVCDNPYLNNKSYIDVINNQQEFLTPQNSNY